MKTTIDEGFIGRVYKTSAFLWVFGLLVCLSFQNVHAAIGWTLGSGASFAILRSLEWIVRRSFVPGAPNAGRDLTKFSLVKLPIILAVLAAIVLLGGRSFALVAAFCAGLVLTQAVIFLKVLGMLVARHPSA